MAKNRTWRNVNWRAVERLLANHDGISELLKDDLLLGVARLKKTAMESCFQRAKRTHGKKPGEGK